MSGNNNLSKTGNIDSFIWHIYTSQYIFTHRDTIEK